MILNNHACALVLSVALVSSSAVAQDYGNAIGNIQVTDNIHMLTGNGGNTGVLIGTDGTFMIDDKFTPLSEPIMVMPPQSDAALPVKPDVATVCLPVGASRQRSTYRSFR